MVCETKVRLIKLFFMKTAVYLFTLLFITSVFAQDFECLPKMANYQELYKAKKIAESFAIWNEVIKNCPAENEIIYIDGFTILQYKIDTAVNDADKLILVRDKMKLYDQYHKNFPSSAVDFEVSKAMILYDNKIDAKDEIFTLLNNGFLKASSSITNASAIYLYLSLCYEKHKEGKKEFTAAFVIEKYTLATFMLTQLQVSNPSKELEYKTAQGGINALLQDVVTCDNLSAFYEKNYPSNQDNQDWIATGVLSLAEKCSAKPIFNDLATKFYAKTVTAQSAFYMAISATNQRKIPEAIQFYNESAELETNPTKKAIIYYQLGTGLESGDKSKSKEYLNKALIFNPKMGKAYLYLAQIYSFSTEGCGTTDFEKKAIIYLASQTAKKAGEVEPKLIPAAAKIESDFKSRTLTQDDIKKAKMNGKSLTIGCWINETITFPEK